MPLIVDMWNSLEARKLQIIKTLELNITLVYLYQQKIVFHKKSTNINRDSPKDSNILFIISIVYLDLSKGKYGKEGPSQ